MTGGARSCGALIHSRRAGISRDFLGYRILLTHRHRHIVCNLAKLLDRCRYLLYGLNRSRDVCSMDTMCRVISPVAFPVWVARPLTSGETTAGFSGAGGLDCCVERKQICLRGNAADEVTDLADLVDRSGQALDGVCNGLGLVGRLARDRS